MKLGQIGEERWVFKTPWQGMVKKKRSTFITISIDTINSSKVEMKSPKNCRNTCLIQKLIEVGSQTTLN